MADEQFLRASRVDDILKNQPNVPTSVLDTIVRSANAHWTGNSRKKLSFSPFEDRDPIVKMLKSASYQRISHLHHRLLLEEIVRKLRNRLHY